MPSSISSASIDDTQLLLAEGQVAEKSGDWIKAIAIRNRALDVLLQRTEKIPTAREQDKLDPLELLGEHYRPSKRNHDYLRRYWRHFSEFHLSARKVVEVGVQTERSICMWEQFFPNATIFGIDIDEECRRFAGGRRQIFIGDQMDEKFLKRFVAETGGDFDIVIDDGLHTSYAMVRTFSFLYPALQSHGLYVIEDIMRQPEMHAFLRLLMDCVNFVPADFDLREWGKLTSFPPQAPWLVRNTVGVSLYRYIAFVERGFNPRDNPFLLEPEVHDARRVEQRDLIAQAAESLRQAGVVVSHETLVAKLGRGHANSIRRYFAEQNPR